MKGREKLDTLVARLKEDGLSVGYGKEFRIIYIEGEKNEVEEVHVILPPHIHKVIEDFGVDAVYTAISKVVDELERKKRKWRTGITEI